MKKVHFVGYIPWQNPNLKFKSNLIFHNTNTPTSLYLKTARKYTESAFEMVP